MKTHTLLKVDTVHKHFGGIIALQRVSMQAKSGQITGLIGPNGSGKSTLFNVISGFLSADQGEVVFRGHRITRMPPNQIAELGLFRSFQSSLNPQSMTVMENMLLSPPGQTGEGIMAALLQPGRVRRQETRNLDRAWTILEQLQLEEKADTFVGDLSGGQKKLLSLAQALMIDPQIILLDEPVAGVNPRLIDDIMEAILELKKQGQNFLIVEHNMQFVRQICDMVYVLDAGEVIASGPTMETLEKPEVLEAYLAAPRNEGPQVEAEEQALAEA
jgi:ABC-type branched-subunit amino acid transport system ATPase component